MANLHITPCHQETGRQRYHLPELAIIPFEYRGFPPPPAPVTATDTIEGESTDTDTFLGLDDLVASGTSNPEVAHAEGEDGEDGEDDGDDGDDGDGGDGGGEEHAAFTAAADGHEEPHDESDENSTEMSEEDSSEESDDDPGEDSDREDFPAASKWRLNLTALSQRYNLFFAAYHNSIHVSRPRSCITHSLPAAPDLTLAPAASREGLVTPGAIDISDSHQVNHLIVGLLGELEILLMAYDDGDVVGYYTKEIEDTIGDSSLPVRRHDLTPFFHENVGRSAWGLAIHQKSRLIAVGSNDRAVFVFVPALVGETETPPPKGPGSAVDNRELESSILDRPRPSSSMFFALKKNDMGQVVWSELEGFPEAEPWDLEAWFSLRIVSFRIELPTGESGHNIPNLTFASDEKGRANNILAVDIRGNLWVMDLVSYKPHIRIPGIHPRAIFRGALDERQGLMGWGVLCIPESCFLPTKSFRDALGLDEEEARYIEWRDDRWIDISRGIQRVPNNSTVHRWSRRPNTAFNREHSRRLEMHPWFGTHELLQYPPEWGGPLEPQEEEWFLRDGSSILRTYETDIELRPYEEGGIGIMYEKSMAQVRCPGLAQARLAMERLGTLLLVPELSLVVGASMTGRVALVTLTRHNPTNETFDLKRGFKIEAILPTEQDENKNLRPLCPLYGVAVGPLPQTSRAEAAGPARYRLMIHYYDLSILSYEISRDPGTKELSFMVI